MTIISVAKITLQDYDRITEWFGLEGTLKIIQFNPPAMVRDIFH